MSGIIKSLRIGASHAAFEAEKARRIAQIQAKIRGLDAEIAKFLPEVGQVAYKLYKAGEVSQPKLIQACHTIDVLSGQKNARMQEVETIRQESYAAPQQPAAVQRVCPNGHGVLKPGAIFCPVCGGKAVDQAISLPAHVTCATCGNALAEDSKFCSKCGTPVMQDTPAPLVTESPFPQSVVSEPAPTVIIPPQVEESSAPVESAFNAPALTPVPESSEPVTERLTFESALDAQEDTLPDLSPSTEQMIEPSSRILDTIQAENERANLAPAMQVLESAKRNQKESEAAIAEHESEMVERLKQAAEDTEARRNAIDNAELGYLAEQESIENPPEMLTPGIITCPICGTETVSGAKFCPKCGTPMGQSASEPIETLPAPELIPTPAQAQIDSRTCPSCGTEIAPRGKFCPKCGTSMDPVDSEPVTAPSALQSAEVPLPEPAIPVSENTKTLAFDAPPLLPEPIPSPVEVQSDSRICPDCGTDTVARAKFCPKCGYKY